MPVIAVSANAMPSDVDRGIAAGFADYLTKPNDLNQLISCFAAVLPPNPPDRLLPPAPRAT